jgi:hypothetical protein
MAARRRRAPAIKGPFRAVRRLEERRAFGEACRATIVSDHDYSGKVAGRRAETRQGPSATLLSCYIASSATHTYGNRDATSNAGTDDGSSGDGSSGDGSSSDGGAGKGSSDGDNNDDGNTTPKQVSARRLSRMHPTARLVPPQVRSEAAA